MATNVDMTGVSGNMADAPPAQKFSLSTLTTKFPGLGELVQEVRTNIRPWSQFFNYTNLQMITNVQRLSNRILRNLAYFQMNYICVCVVLILYCLLTSPLILIIIAAILYASYRIKQLPSPVTLFGREWTVNQLCIGLHIAAIPILYLVGFSSIMFWVIGASTLVIALHAIFYNIDAIVTEDNDGFMTETITI